MVWRRLLSKEQAKERVLIVDDAIFWAFESIYIDRHEKKARRQAIKEQEQAAKRKEEVVGSKPQRQLSCQEQEGSQR